jgi:hypothetical protein
MNATLKKFEVSDMGRVERQDFDSQGAHLGSLGKKIIGLLSMFEVMLRLYLD